MGDSLEDIRAALRRRDEASPPPPLDAAEGRGARLVTATLAMARRGITDVSTAASDFEAAVRFGPPWSERIATAIAGAATRIDPAATAVARGATAMARGTTVMARRAMTLYGPSRDAATRVWVAVGNAAKSRQRSPQPLVVPSQPASAAPTAPPSRPRQADFEEGASLELRQAEHRLAAAERAFGYDHPSVAAELQLIGALHHQAGKYDEALAFYGAALGIQERTLGLGNVAAVETAHDAAIARQEELGALETAEV